MRKVLIVGEAPGRSGGPVAFGGGRSGRRLAELAGVPQLQDAFRTVNLLPAWPGQDGKGSAFPAREAGHAARLLAASFPPGSTVLLAGKRVAGAFGIAGCGYLQWFKLGRARVAIIPHPSGINLWWNDPVNVRRVGVFLRNLARKALVG